ncbi:MAG: hypothetical protein NVS3B1_08700 [Marmoricola sp.]
MLELDGQAVWGRELGVLWTDVVSARAAVAEQRQDPRSHPGVGPRQSLILALECYLSFIIQRGYPAPYGLTNELNVQRGVCRWIGSSSALG